MFERGTDRVRRVLILALAQQGITAEMLREQRCRQLGVESAMELGSAASYGAEDRRIPMSSGVKKSTMVQSRQLRRHHHAQLDTAMQLRGTAAPSWRPKLGGSFPRLTGRAAEWTVHPPSSSVSGSAFPSESSDPALPTRLKATA